MYYFFFILIFEIESIIELVLRLFIVLNNRFILNLVFEGVDDWGCV